MQTRLSGSCVEPQHLEGKKSHEDQGHYWLHMELEYLRSYLSK